MATRRSGTIIYGHADMPDDFAEAVAKALDEHQELPQWRNNTFSYNQTLKRLSPGPEYTAYPAA